MPHQPIFQSSWPPHDTRGCWRVDPVRYPLAPIEVLWPDPRVLADAIGCTYRSVFRWRAGGMNWVIADVVAGRLGVGPWELWPEWFDNVVEREEC